MARGYIQAGPRGRIRIKRTGLYPRCYNVGGSTRSHLARDVWLLVGPTTARGGGEGHRPERSHESVKPAAGAICGTNELYY